MCLCTDAVPQGVVFSVSSVPLWCNVVRAAAGMAWLTLRTLASGRRAWAAAALLALPPILATLVAALGRNAEAAEVFRNVAFFFTLWFMIYFLALIFGVSLSSGEIEDGTAGYVYLSAVPKWLTVVIQVAVTAAALTALLGGSLLLTALGAGFAEGSLPRFWRDVAVCTLVGGAGLLISLSFYVTCGFVIRHPLGALAAAVIPTFFWEFMVTWWPIRFAEFTVTNNLRGLLLTLLFEGRRSSQYKYVKNFQIPDYGEAAMYLSVLAGLFLVTAMVAAMNRSIEGKEAR